MVRCTACTARATIAHATRERGHPHLSPALSAAHSYPSSAGRSLRSLGSRTSRCLGGGEGELGGAACVPPPPFGGRGTGGGGPVVCATLSRARDPICCAHDPFAAPATFQARATRACETACPAESHLSHLIPLNPGKSRLENCVYGLSLCFRSHQMLIGLLRSRHGFRTVPGDVRELLDLRKLVSSAVRQAGGPVFGSD